MGRTQRKLTGSAFALNRETRRGGILSFWSRDARSHFAGRDGTLSLGGDVRTTMFGADYAKGPLVTGLSLSHSRSLGDYAGVGSGQVASAVTGVHPWAGLQSERPHHGVGRRWLRRRRHAADGPIADRPLESGLREFLRWEGKEISTRTRTLADDDTGPYCWAATYDSGLVSALSGDVTVALVDRSSPSVRWIQGGIVTERTRLSVVSITDLTEESTELVLGEDVEFNVARQRLTRVAGALGSGTTLTVRYVADLVIEDSVSSNRPVHLTEHAEFDTASIGAARARAALDLYAQPVQIIRAAMRTGHDRHIGEGQLVTLPAAQLRLMGIPGVTGDERWLVDEVSISGGGNLLRYSLRLVRGLASSSFVEFWRRRPAG